VFSKRIILIALACTLSMTGSHRVGWAAESAPFGDAVLVDASPFKGRVQSIDAKGVIAWQLLSGDVKKSALADLCWWGQWLEPRAQSQVVLVDGSLIAADVISIDKEHLSADWSLGGEFKLPLDWVGGILLAPPIDRQAADALRFRLLGGHVHGSNGQTLARSASEEFPANARKSESDRDGLILLNSDELAGQILSLDENAVKIRAAAGEMTIAKEKIAAAAFNPSLAAKPSPADARLWVGTTDGSRILASSLVIEGDSAKLKLAGGVSLTAPPAKIVAIQPLAGRTTYLSDMKPAGYQHIPFLDLNWPYKTDRNVLGTQLRAGGRNFLKGLGMHSAARLTYNLEKPYRTFASEAAIDDQTGGRGSAVFRVYIDDGSGTWQLKFESPIVRGGAAPVPISIDLAGAKRLSLLVDFADHGDEQAHADWLNSRLLP
jgi:hypothetical protein